MDTYGALRGFLLIESFVKADIFVGRVEVKLETLVELPGGAILALFTQQRYLHVCFCVD